MAPMAGKLSDNQGVLAVTSANDRYLDVALYNFLGWVCRIVRGKSSYRKASAELHI